MAAIALVQLLVIVGLLVVLWRSRVVAELERGRREAYVSSRVEEAVAGVERRHEGEREFLRKELAKALDRIQDPASAVAESQTERMPAPSSPIKRERSLGEVERERELRDLERQVASELERRGVDASELSSGIPPVSG